MARLEHTGNITEENDASKHKCSANPMGYTERVLEIPDGEKKAEKFPETDEMQVRGLGLGKGLYGVGFHLQVRTRVAVRLGHSAVSTNTADMQRYWEQSTIEYLTG